VRKRVGALQTVMLVHAGWRRSSGPRSSNAAYEGTYSGVEPPHSRVLRTIQSAPRVMSPMADVRYPPIDPKVTKDTKGRTFSLTIILWEFQIVGWW